MTQPAPMSQTATPFDAILVQSRDLFRDRLCAAVGLMFDGSEAALSEAAEKTQDEELQKRYLDARDLAGSHRELIESQFRQRLMGEFQKRTNKAKRIGQSLSDFSLDDLALVGEDDLEETLKFNDMAAKLRRYCEEELGALDQRVGVLLGDASLESDDNPFGPQVICDAYKAACQKLECPLDVRMDFLKLFDDHVLDTVRSTYKEVNELLVENSILPKIRYGISKSESKAPAPGAPSLAEEKEKPAAGEAPPMDPQDMFAQLAKMMAPAGFAGGAAPGMGVGGVPLVQGAELLGSLSQLQVGNLAALGEAAAELGPILAEAGNLKNVLHKLKETSVGAGMGQVDAMTLDVVAMLFDELFEDPKIPIALKGLIGRLQLPMLKVAIADKELFTKKTHPARQLLDVLGQIGLRLPAEFDSDSPLFPRLEAFVQELVDGFQEKMEIFDKVRADLEAIIAEDDARVSREMESSQKELQQGERLALAKVAAEEEIRKRVAGATGLPRPIVRFLALQWIKYLVIVHAREGGQSETWKGAVETMDQLLGSITPKATVEERRGVARVIPALLKRLKGGVADAGIEDAVSTSFFTELMKCHTEVMHTAAPPPKAPAAEPTGTAAEIAASAKIAAKLAAREAAREAAAAAAREATASASKDPRAATASTLKDPRAATASTLKDPRAAKPAPPADTVEELDFTAPVEVNNPFGEGKVAVSSEDLDFTAVDGHAAPAVAAEEPPADAQPAPGAHAGAGEAKPAAPARAPKRETIRLPSAMVIGAWVEVLDEHDSQTRHPAKLHYISPMKSHFLFVDRQGKKVYECSRSMLSRRLKLGEVTLLDGEPDASLFDRIMHGIFGKLRTNAVPA